MALEHTLNASDVERCVRLMTRLVLPTVSNGPGLDRGAVAGHGRQLRDRAASAARGPGRLGRGAGRPDRRGTALGGHPRVGVLRRSTRGRHGVVRLGEGDVAGHDVRGRPEQMLVDTNFAVAQEPSWSPWRDTALGLCAEAHLLTGDVERAAGLFAKASAAAATSGNAGSLVFSEAQLAQIAMDQGRWAEAAKRTELARAAIEKHRLHDYAISVLAFVSAARLEVQRGNSKEADRQLNHAMRARPSCTSAMPSIAVRVRLRLAKLFLARADTATARQLVGEIDDVLDHCPELGALVAEVAELRDIVASSVQRGWPAERPQPGRAAAAAVLADPPHDQRDRRTAVRHPQHHQLRGHFDLSQARRLLAQPRRAAGDGDRAARRLARS